MAWRTERRAAAALLLALSAAAMAQGNPEQPRGAAAPPAALTAEDRQVLPEPPAGFADERPGIARGQVEEFAYDSAVTGTKRKAMVYLPPGLVAGRRYPVLYLLHGLGGNHHEWTGYVRAHAILDQLIADGRVVPMIVVMPNGRALADDQPWPPERRLAPEHVAGFARFERDLLQHLIPAVEARYPALPDRRQRAIAGLSMGGGQALNFGLGHLDQFAWVGGFSSAPNTRPPAELMPDADAARRQLALLYLSCGSQDGLIHVSQGLQRHLKQHAIAHVWNVDSHGHDRESWAGNLYHFAQLIFR